MSFDDLAAKFRDQADQSGGGPSDFTELYRVRARILGVLIRDARQSAQMSATTCAERVGVPVETLDDWELGRAVPSLPQLELLAYTLRLPISHFWGTELLAPEQHQLLDAEEYHKLRDRLIGMALRKARRNARLTVAELAEAAGVSADHVRAYETGLRAIPTPVLASLASACRVNMTHFLENDNRVGRYLLLQEDIRKFSDLPETVRQFVAQPVNEPYLDLALRLSQMETDELRAIATAILEITL